MFAYINYKRSFNNGNIFILIGKNYMKVTDQLNHEPPTQTMIWKIAETLLPAPFVTACSCMINLWMFLTRRHSLKMCLLFVGFGLFSSLPSSLKHTSALFAVCRHLIAFQPQHWNQSLIFYLTSSIKFLCTILPLPPIINAPFDVIIQPPARKLWRHFCEDRLIFYMIKLELSFSILA